jgi:hypothetical protein
MSSSFKAKGHHRGGQGRQHRSGQEEEGRQRQGKDASECRHRLKPKDIIEEGKDGNIDPGKKKKDDNVKVKIHLNVVIV